MRYGQLPKELGQHEVDCREMMFYQYLPIKMPDKTQPIYEQRLKYFDNLVGIICCDFIGTFGLDKYVSYYIYLTAKYMYQSPHCSFNREGYHSDGFMTNDINYIWCDKNPTVFNSSYFELTEDDAASLSEMQSQALPEREVCYPENTLLRLNQYNIHKVSDTVEGGMRAFLKISFSSDMYDLLGNSHNYLIDYDWHMRSRKPNRNIPQNIKI